MADLAGIMHYLCLCNYWVNKEKERMKYYLLVLALLLTACSAKEESAEMKELQRQFELKVLALASDDDLPMYGVQERIAVEAANIFNHHPEVLTVEAQRRYESLDVYAKSQLSNYELRMDESGFAKDEDFQEYMGLLSWQPIKSAAFMRSMILARTLGPEQMAKKQMLSMAVPAKNFQLEGAEKPTIVMQSLNDVFVAEYQSSEFGGLVPNTIKWYQKKSF